MLPHNHPPLDTFRIFLSLFWSAGFRTLEPKPNRLEQKVLKPTVSRELSAIIASRNDQIWPRTSFITCFIAFLHVFSRKKGHTPPLIPLGPSLRGNDEKFRTSWRQDKTNWSRKWKGRFLFKLQSFFLLCYLPIIAANPFSTTTFNLVPNVVSTEHQVRSGFKVWGWSISLMYLWLKELTNSLSNM